MLTIELIPKTAWNINVRSELPKKEWDRLRREAYRLADYKCEICGGVGHKHPVECHEIWEYNETDHIQILRGLTAICPSCHEVKHIGRAQIMGHYDRAREHLAKVNKWSIKEAEKYIREQFAVWRKRSESEWELNLSWLENNV
ncbi:MAG: HNH endonuclease [Synergistaceae bacterium]